jgi:hypothetical protein
MQKKTPIKRGLYVFVLVVDNCGLTPSNPFGITFIPLLAQTGTGFVELNSICSG